MAIAWLAFSRSVTGPHYDLLAARRGRISKRILLRILLDQLNFNSRQITVEAKKI